jgi:hypothetical protein
MYLYLHSCLCWPPLLLQLMPVPEGLEAGTMPFLDIISLKYGFDLFKTMGGMQVRG